MLSPATLAALHRLIAVLLALLDALAVPVNGAPRPLAARLAIRAFSAHLNGLVTRLSGMTGQPATGPAPTPPPTPVRHIGRRRAQAPRIIQSPTSLAPRAGLSTSKIERGAPRLSTPNMLRFRN